MHLFKHNSGKVSGLSFAHLLDAQQITTNDLSKIFFLAEQYQRETRRGIKSRRECEGHILATLFFEPSTRTRFSFETAMLRLGGQVISLEQGLSSSLVKGESLADMGRVMSGYADMIVMRHPEAGSVSTFAEHALIPVINGGDGANQHPTQSLADLYTIRHEKGRLDHLTIGIIGDLKHSRTAHSLITLMHKYPGNRFVLISHPSLRMDMREIKRNACEIEEVENLAQVISQLDVLYVTRLQEERFPNPEECREIKDRYCIRRQNLVDAKPDVVLMHALPRVNEIHPEIDSLPQAKYFEQADRAVFVRMALLSLMKENDLKSKQALFA